MAEQADVSQGQAGAVKPVEVAQPSGAGANAATARVTFQFERAGVTVPQFLLAIDEGGNASYAAELALPGGAQDGKSSSPATQHVEQKMVLTRATTNRIFALARASDRFNLAAPRWRRILRTLGKKDAALQRAGWGGLVRLQLLREQERGGADESYDGIVRTLDAGRKLDFDHRFDRLGLDEDSAALAEDVADGRAIEVGTIARTLRSIAADEEVLERVRGRASSLLQRFPPAQE